MLSVLLQDLQFLGFDVYIIDHTSLHKIHNLLISNFITSLFTGLQN